jgi:hypothetical protein
MPPNACGRQKEREAIAVPQQECWENQGDSKPWLVVSRPVVKNSDKLLAIGASGQPRTGTLRSAVGNLYDHALTPAALEEFSIAFRAVATWYASCLFTPD